jgi:hypothetical protein
MSRDAVAYVWRFSPAETASQLVVHLAIADTVNEENDWRLWMTQEELATKAGVSRKTVNDALAFLVTHGALSRPDDRTKNRGLAVQFRFVFARHCPQRWQPRRVTRSDRSVTSGDRGVTPLHTELEVETEQLLISPGVATEAVRSIGEKLRKGTINH